MRSRISKPERFHTRLGGEQKARGKGQKLAGHGGAHLQSTVHRRLRLKLPEFKANLEDGVRPCLKIK